MLYNNTLDEFAEGVNTDLYLLPTTNGQTRIYAADQYTLVDIKWVLKGRNISRILKTMLCQGPSCIISKSVSP